MVVIHKLYFPFGFFGDVDEVYYKTGELKGKGNIIDGFPYGEWVFFDRNGNKIVQGSYSTNSKKEKKWKYFDSKGNLLYEVVFENGIPIDTLKK